jgi:hypothetical protein
MKYLITPTKESNESNNYCFINAAPKKSEKLRAVTLNDPG